MIFFTSDTHFGHKAIIRFQRKQFKTVEEMDAVLIRYWNHIVDKTDTVYHLGDFSFYNSRGTEEILEQLNGHIHLIFGNHDHSGKSFSHAIKLRFESMSHYKELKVDGAPRITLSHYPFLTWNQSHYGSWSLHGHSHGSLKYPGKRYDVGVDNNDYIPVAIDDLHEIMNTRTISFNDYHLPKEMRDDKIS